jgi:DNA-binding CsgD family transcriptional regulator
MTDRELEAFGYLGQGMTTQQIAVKMHVSPKTVETYRARIKEKLGLRNATELIHSAVQWVMGQCSEAPAQNGDGVLTKSESADERKQT